MTDKCEPAPANLPAKQVYDNLTSVIPTLSFDVEGEFNGGLPAVLLNESGPVLPTACLEFFPKQSVLAAPSKTSTSNSGRLYVSVTGLLVVAVLMLFA